MQSYMFLFDEWWYVLILVAVMITAGMIKQYNLFFPFYNFLIRHIGNKKLLVVLLSMVGGVLPVPGRVVISAGLLDTVAPLHPKKRAKFGIIDYLSTHHYYLWSPLEKTILIPMAVLRLSYGEVLSYTWPLLAVTLLFLCIYIIRLEEVEIEITPVHPDSVSIRKWYTFIEWKTIVFVFGVLLIGNYIKQCHGIIKSYTENAVCHDPHTWYTFMCMTIMAFFGSFILGSSSKFAGMVVLLTNIFGLHYFTYLFALEYAGYLLSPSHKCLAIGMLYFSTPFKMYYRTVLTWAGLIVITGILTLL